MDARVLLVVGMWLLCFFGCLLGCHKMVPRALFVIVRRLLCGSSVAQ